MKTKVKPEMRVAYENIGIAGCKPVPTPTGRYEVQVRKTGDVICVAPNEYVAESLAALLHIHSDEWNSLIELNKR